MVDSSYRHCFETAAAAAGRTLTDAELDRVFTRTQGRMNRYIQQGLTPTEAAQRVGTELGAEAKLASAIEARSQKINKLVQMRLQAREVPERELDTVTAALTGIEKKGNFRGAADSADAMGNAYVDRQMGAMTSELEQAGLLKAIMKGNREFDRDLANEIGRINDPTWGKATGNKFAAAAAKTINKYMEAVRLQQNDAGAWIGKLDQYFMRQAHDAEKVRAVPYETWRDAILPRLDDRTFADFDTPQDREVFLHDVYKAIGSGVHEGATGADWLAGFKGPANLAKRVSQERKLFFKSADDGYEYNLQFGHGTTRDTIFKTIEHGARNAGIMKVLGTNPEAMLEGWVDRLSTKAKDRGDLAQASKIQESAGKFSDILDFVMRKGTGTEVPTLTKVLGTVRSLQDFKLGGFLSYISDLQTVASAARHNGIGMLESYGNSIAGLLPQGTARRRAALELGQGFDGFTGGVISRLRAYDGARGRLASMASTFEKWNGVKWWVNSQKSAFGRMLSGNLARLKGSSFAELPRLLQTTLRRYGIEDPEWEVIRKLATTGPDGHAYVFPNSAMQLDDADVAGLGATSPEGAHVAKQAIMDKLSSYITDQVRTGMSEPTAGISRAMLGNKKPATTVSEIRRAILQFKTFPMTHVMRSVTREWMRDGVDVAGVSKLIAGTTALGYAAYSLKRLTHGQAPVLMDPNHKNSAGDYLKAVTAGIAQGGGLGLYGDFLFGSTSRFGGGPLEEALGPSFAAAAQVAKMFADDKEDLMDGKLTGRKLATQGINLFKANAPMVNLFYARWALDYAILYSLQERINPGYLRRYEKQTTQSEGVGYYMHPTTAHLHTFGR